jgi:hypothetical protein
MPFEAVTNLASAEAADAERKRREAEAALQEEARLAAGERKAAMEAQALDAASGPAALLRDLQGGGRGRAAVAGDVLRNAEQDDFLNQQADRRIDRQFDQRETDLQRRATALAVPGPTATERALTMSAGAGRFGTEDANARAQELKLNPRGRMADLDTLIADVSRETRAPDARIYTDAPKARGGSDTAPYAGALDELLGMEVPRAGIRREHGGTAEDRTLSFSDRQEPGMRHYNNPATGEARDVGAPGGGLVSGTKPPDTSAKDAVLAGLREERAMAERAPFTPQELAKDLSVQQPGWDARAAGLNPAAVDELINAEVGDGRLNPRTGQFLRERYDGFARRAYNEQGEFSDETWANLLGTPDSAALRAQQGGQAVPQAKAAEQAAVQDALQAPQDGPGSTPSPALAAQSEAAGATPPRARRPPQRVPYGGSGGSVDVANLLDLDAPFIPEGMGQAGTPPWLAGLPENIRLVLEGAQFAAGGRENPAERRRRLARERG